MPMQEHVLQKALMAIVDVEALPPESQEELATRLREECSRRQDKGMGESEALAEALQATAAFHTVLAIRRAKASRPPVGMLMIVLVTLLLFMNICIRIAPQIKDVIAQVRLEPSTFTLCALAVSGVVGTFWPIPALVAGWLLWVIAREVRRKALEFRRADAVAAGVAFLMLLVLAVTVGALMEPLFELLQAIGSRKR